MIVAICEECGRKYRIDSSKMKGKVAKFTCKACNHIILVKKPEEKRAAAPDDASLKFIEPEPDPEPDFAPEPEPELSNFMGEPEPDLSDILEEPAPETPAPAAKPAPPPRPTPAPPKKGGLGLRAKMTVLFLTIPILLIAGASALYLQQMENLSSLLTQKSSEMVSKMAEDTIAESARAVAMQVKLYLQDRPQLTNKDFNYEMGFRRVAVQKLGMTGYTALYARPDEDGIWRTWAHVDPKLIGIDMKTVEKGLKKNFGPFWKIFTGVKEGRESRGYYDWRDQRDELRKKFMVCSPIEGTPYVISATTYLDEFTRPATLLQTRAKKITKRIRYYVFGIFGGTLLLIALVVSIYGHRLTRRITSLTEIADQISVGELDAEIDVTSKDELGELGEAISRMQDSIRLSIERLRRRR